MKTCSTLPDQPRTRRNALLSLLAALTLALPACGDEMAGPVSDGVPGPADDDDEEEDPSIGQCKGQSCCPALMPAIWYDDTPNVLPDSPDGFCHVTLGGNDDVTLAGPGEAAVVSGDGDDRVVGSDGPEQFYGGGGSDEIDGGGGDDRIEGRAGPDVLRGGPGRDTILAGGGADTVDGGPGNDVVLASVGADTVFGGDGDDQLVGDRGRDTLDGGAGADVIDPGPGADRVQGGPGDDTVRIFDTCEIEAGMRVDGGEGRDVLLLPVPRAEAESMGLEIAGFEEVRVEPHPCLSMCRLPLCGPGECVEVEGTRDFTCVCPQGYSGDRCQECAPGWDGPSCSSCAPGFHLEGRDGGPVPIPPGDDDSRATDDDSLPAIDRADVACVADGSCADLDCGAGTCILSGGQPSCACPRGSTGPGCAECLPFHEPQPDGTCAIEASCDQDMCGGRGTCVDVAVGHDPPPEIACACDPGYDGELCTHCAPGYHGAAVDGQMRCVLDEACGPDACSGHGTCAVVDGRATCTCDADYYGEDCSRTCVGNTCGGNGTCAVDDDGPACACEDGWDPDTDCTTCRTGYELQPGGACAAVACSDPQVQCAGHGSCVQFGDIPVCACDEGYIGWGCDACAAGYVWADGACVPLATCDQDVCSGNGACQVSHGVATCTCDSGFFGEDCTLINPPTVLWVSGQGTPPEPGQAHVLRPVLDGIGDYAKDLVWTVASGGGTLTPGEGDTMIYTPPVEETDGPVTVEVHPACCAEVSSQVPVLPYTVGKIAITRSEGFNDDLFGWFDRALVDFMWDRCVGGLAVAVAVDGVEVYSAAYGRVDGAPTIGVNGEWQARCKDHFISTPDGSRVLRPDDPVRLGSASKVLLAAMVRWAIRKRWLEKHGDPGAYKLPGPPLSDDAIEAIQLCGGGGFHRYELLPKRLSDILCGYEPLPFPDQQKPSAERPEKCSSNLPCFNGGQCGVKQWVEPDENGDPQPVLGPGCFCPPGYSGNLCEIRDDMWSSAIHYADPRWRQVTLGHLMSHRSGNPGTASLGATLSLIDRIRGWATREDLRDDEAGLAALGAGDATAAHGALQDLLHLDFGFGPTPMFEAFFVQQPTLEELFIATLQKALIFDPGAESKYVNGNFSIQHLVIETLVGKPFAPRYDRDVAAEDTALGEFLASEIGIGGGTVSELGIAPAHVVPGELEDDAVRYRQWWKGGSSWYPGAWDKKVPHLVCRRQAPNPFVAVPDTCSVRSWSRAKDGRFVWGSLGEGAVPYRVAVQRAGTGMSPGQGAMAVELPLWLKILRRYQVSGAYGRPRDATRVREHSGLVPSFIAAWEVQFGTDSGAAQLGGTCTQDADCGANEACFRWFDSSDPHVESRCFTEDGVKYSIPVPDSNTGRIPRDRPDSEREAFKCNLPNVDVVISVNQARDVDPADLVAEKKIAPYVGRGGRLREVLKHALCTVNWSSVSTLYPKSLKNKLTP